MSALVVAMPHIPLDKWPCQQGLLWLLMTTMPAGLLSLSKHKLKSTFALFLSLSPALSESYRGLCEGIYATTRGPWTAFGLFLKKGRMNKKGKCCHLLSQGV